MIELFVVGVAVRGDGLDGWTAARPILAGAAPYIQKPALLPPPAILAANERRRASLVTRLALSVAQEAADSSCLAPASLRSTFGSANGDGATVHGILESLAGPDRFVSPTQFHKSVHNAAAGYWSIGTGSAQPATCLGCHDSTVAASLMAAAAEAEVEQTPVLVCVYDIPLPLPLDLARPTAGVFGAGLVLASEAPRPLARLRFDWQPEPAPPGAAAPRNDLGGLAWSNPAARILRLLEALATQQPDHIALTLLDAHLAIDVQPC
jgi:Beta-ketoacyl synthase, N-terminal domain